MSFLPGRVDDQAQAPPPSSESPPPAALSQPEEEASAGGMVDSRHVDLHLQTRLSSERLQARLLEMYYDSQTYEQEQGTSILYLATGFLKWYESPTSDKVRFAPLLLLPVDLERSSVRSRFKVRLRDADITTNLSLQAKLKAEFEVALPEVPDLDELSTTAYFEAVEQAIVDQPRWEVLRNDMMLWFFSFAKYLMYRDLDPSNWPAHATLESNPTLSALLQDGFSSEPPLCGDEEKIDPLISPQQMIHVTDADSSQAVVIEEVRRGAAWSSRDRRGPASRRPSPTSSPPRSRRVRRSCSSPRRWPPSRSSTAGWNASAWASSAWSCTAARPARRPSSRRSIAR